MLIKMIVVSSNHFIRYKCKPTHCLESQTLLGCQTLYITVYITIDDIEKLSINEELGVLMSVRTFSNTSSFDTHCLILSERRTSN